MPPSTPPEPALQTAARLLAEGRPAAAASRLADLVAEAPTYAAAHVLRATALEAAGFVDESIVSWGRAAALVPRSPLVHRERERLMATRISDDSALPPPVPEAATEPPATPRAAYVEAASDLEAAPGLEGETPSIPETAHDLEAEDPRENVSALEGASLEGASPEDEAPDSPSKAADSARAVEPPRARSDADDLDDLIAQLDEAPRIRPDPTYSGPEVSLETPEVDDLASETLAKIYAAQHQYVEAAVIYEKLAARQPDQADELLNRAAELRRRG